MKVFLVILLILTSLILWDSFTTFNNPGSTNYGSPSQLEYRYNMDSEDFRPVNMLKPIMIILSVLSIISLIFMNRHSGKILIGTSVFFIVSAVWTWIYVIWYCREWLGNGVFGIPMEHSMILIPAFMALALAKKPSFKMQVEALTA